MKINYTEKAKGFVQAGICAVLFMGVAYLGFFISDSVTAWQERAQEKNKPAITVQDLRERLQQAEGYAAVLETIKFYKHHNNDNGYNQNPEHLLEVWNLCVAYADTITDARWIDALKRPAEEKEKLKREICETDIPLFMFCASADESAYDPNAVATNKNKTQDFGITQINQECHAEIDPWLPKDLRERPWTDTEKNIAGRYVWIMNRARAGQAWDKMTQRRGWALYKRLKKATENFKGDGPCSSLSATK